MRSTLSLWQLQLENRNLSDQVLYTKYTSAAPCRKLQPLSTTVVREVHFASTRQRMCKTLSFLLPNTLCFSKLTNDRYFLCYFTPYRVAVSRAGFGLEKPPNTMPRLQGLLDNLTCVQEDVDSLRRNLKDSSCQLPQSDKHNAIHGSSASWQSASSTLPTESPRLGQK